MKKIFTAIFFIVYFSFSIFSQSTTITTVAGYYYAGVGYFGDGGPAYSAETGNTYDVCFDKSGNYYVADAGNDVIRKVNTYGTISTYAGDHYAGVGYTGDGGPATAAELFDPAGVTCDPSQNLYISDKGNNVIRKVDKSKQDISTYAGNYIYGQGYSGDGGPATSAELSNPMGVAWDASGNLYIADQGNNVVRKVTNGGVISTIAGNHSSGYGGDGGPAMVAELSAPTRICLDALGNLYIADAGNHVVRKVVLSSGIITTVAGNFLAGPGYSGDGGPATIAEFGTPSGLVCDTANNLYISDQADNVVRRLFRKTGVIRTIVGTGYGMPNSGGFSGDGGLATAAELYNPMGLAFDIFSDLFIADYSNHVIRRLGVVPTYVESMQDVYQKVRIYPNPNNGNFKMEILNQEAGTINIEIYNLMGQKVYSSSSQYLIPNSEFQVNLGNKPNGVYIYRVVDGNGNLVGEGKLEITK